MSINRARARRKRKRERARHPKLTSKEMRYLRDLREMQAFMDATSPGWRTKAQFNELMRIVGERMSEGLKTIAGVFGPTNPMAMLKAVTAQLPPGAKVTASNVVHDSLILDIEIKP